MKTATMPAAAPTTVRRKFDHALKREAVSLWINSGKSASQIAAGLGVAQNRLYLWKRQFAPSVAPAQSELEAQLLALRRENAYLREQRDILKKTLGILSQPPSSATSGSTR